MSQGLITGVANGSATVTVNYPAYTLSATTPITVTTGGGGGGGGITAIKLFYNSQDVSTYNGLLMFTGNTYTVTAKDQAGNILSNASGSWASTDTTNAPISGAGVISPTTGVGGGTVTFTHTASGIVGSVKFSVLKTPPAIYKQMGSPTTTTALMAQIWSNQAQYNDPGYNGGLPNPTGATSSGSLYTDGTGANHFSIEANPASAGHYLMGKAGMVNTLGTSDQRTGRLDVGVSGVTRIWGLQVIRFDPGFSPVGQHPAGNSAAFKWGNWFNVGASGRVGAEQTNGNAAGTTGSVDNYCLVTTPDGGAILPVGNLSTEYTAGETWVNLNLYESRGGNIMSSRMAWFKIGSVPVTPWNGITVEGPMAGGAARGAAPPTAGSYTPTTVNFNQAPVNQTQYVTIFDWQLVNGDTYGDPYGILAATGTATPTLTGITGGTVTRGATSASIVLTGTNFNRNCQPVFSNTGIYPQSITINSSTQMTVVVAVNAGATPGAGTVLVNNQASQADSATAVVTVT